MKALKIALAIVAASTIVSCHMNNELDHPVLSGQVAGTYNGTLRSSLLQTEMSATTEITSINDYTIEVHCYSADVDTTFSLELYPDGDIMRSCFTDSDFRNRYGHNISANHHMMGRLGNWTSWQQHMTAEHDVGDEHFGNFDIKSRTFNYTFDFLSADGGYSQYFTGQR
ncbi:hypothetical protein [uncultured Imperialibacter sp.]|uniref:hypothetical protein n=1 Tax=Imperialibacter sp. TaxID=2038411 RepID=UPI0030D8438B